MTNHLIGLALKEDVGSGDITSRAVVPPRAVARARVIAKQDLVLAGVDVAARVFKTVDKKIKIEIKIRDGERAEKGEVIAIISGPARSILTAERTALNFLQHLSGVATATRKFVDAVRGTGVKILDTRKTTPGWREMEKYAVRLGGGVNHRMGLWDRYLVKGNHVIIAGGIREAIARCKRQEARKVPLFPPLKKGGEGGFEVEVRNLHDVAEALACGADIIMLDNFSPVEVRKAVRLVSSNPPIPPFKKGGRGGIKRPKLEVSGNITLKNVRAYAKTGVDFVSVGSITHSAPVADMNMKVVCNDSSRSFPK